MKRSAAFRVALISAALVLAGSSGAVDTYEVGDAASGIATSRHNLGSTGVHLVTGETTEICVFCHTPHHSNTVNDVKPLWNRYVEQNLSVYTAYGTTTAGTTILSADLGSTTLACLSCHDGVTTFDNIINAPGKAGVTEAGQDLGWSFFDLDGIISDFMTSASITLGRSLSDDHPVSVPYDELVAGLRPRDTIVSAIDLTADMVISAATFDNANLVRNLWAVKGYISDTASINDLLREYNGVMRVECSSCHDPHFNNKSWNEIDITYSSVLLEQEDQSNGLFLRRVGGNSGSSLCRTCHNK